MPRYVVALWLAVAAIAAARAELAPQPRPGVSAQGAGVDSRVRSQETPAGAEQAKLRLREGTRLHNRVGRFRVHGDALYFIDEHDREMGGLPNLNLERIMRMLIAVEEPESVVWSVSGAVTEFSGRNYLLISRAVYKSAAPPPTPESVE